MTFKHTVISLEFNDPYLLVPIYPIHWLYYQKFFFWGGGGERGGGRFLGLFWD